MVRGCGAILLNKPKKLVEIVGAMTKALNSRQVTVKIRTGWDGESSFVYIIIILPSMHIVRNLNC
jgi:tRNA-dihydrouridine synthase